MEVTVIEPAELTVEDAFFGSCETSDRDAMLEAGVPRWYGEGEMIFWEGDESRHVVIVLEGDVKLTKTSSTGDQVILELRGPGELIGELSCIDGMPRSATASALERTETLTISHEAFAELVESRSKICAAMNQLLAQRLREAAERQLESSTVDSFGRVCRRLVELCDRSGVQIDDNWEISSPLSQQELAEWLGISRDAVVRSLGMARRLGWIQTGRRRFLITNIDGLRRQADNVAL